MKQEAASLVEAEARAVIDAPWPSPEDAARGVFADDVPRVRLEPLDPSTRLAVDLDPGLPEVDEGLPFDKKGHTFLDAVALGVADALRADPRVFVYGEDVGGRYGNAFLLLRPLLAEFGDRIINSPIAESGVLGVCVGAALAGQRPDRRDAVQRFRRQRLQSTRQQRGQDPLPVGRLGTDGRPDAVGRSAPCRTVSFAEHRAVVLSNTGAEDRHAFDAGGCAGTAWPPRSPIPIRCCTTSTLRSIGIPGSSRRCQRPRLGPHAVRTCGAAPGGQRPGDHLVRRLRARRDAGGARAGRGRDSGERARSAHARAARQGHRACAWPATAAAC